MANDPRPTLSARLVVQLVLVVLVLPALPLLISADWAWREGWAFFLISTVGFIASRALAARRHPDIIAERARMIDHQDTKTFDKILAPVVAFGLVVIGIVAGFDHRWNGATPWFSDWSRWAALAVLIGSYAFGTWALIENRFFSGVVRIQHDRGHHVVSTGPYRLIRHPGYVGTLIFYLACPVLLASLWAFLPAVIVNVLLVVRTALEDKTLRAELPGYSEYANNTRYRLIPGVW